MIKKRKEFAKLLDRFVAGDLWEWARQHTQTLAAGALLLAALVALAPRPKKSPCATAEPEEIPLFI